MQPNTLRCEYDGGSLYHNWSGIALLIARFGLRLRVCADVCTASARNDIVKFAVLSIEQADSMNARFIRSVTPFCSGEYSADDCQIMPFSLIKFLHLS
jgi:hypothetical protein